MKEGVGKLRLVFWVFIAAYIANLALPLIGPFSHTGRLWLVSSVTIGVLSLLILIREKLPSKATIATGLVFSILAGLIQPFTGAVTFLAFLASMRVMEKVDNGIVTVRRPYALSIFLGVGVGVILGFINLFLAGVQMEFLPSFYALAVSLHPGISEEIIYRLFMYALSIYLLGGRTNAHKETVWVYVLMIVPHVLLHFPDTYFVNGSLHLDLGTLLVNPVILGLLFGLPMTLAMVKRDLASAMLIHTIVDFIRFILLGLPI